VTIRPSPLARLALAAALLLPGRSIAAQATDTVRTRLDAVVVTAARREQRLKDVVVPTEVIGRAEIDRTGATDVAALLQQFTGLQVDGGVGGGQGVQLQGMDSRRVLILVDGQPVIGRVNGDFDLSRLPLAGVERIEIVKGPQSTLYGSEAVGGVINIITRPARGARTVEAQVVAGTRGRSDANLGGRASVGPVRVTGDATLRASDLAVGIPGDLGTHSERWTATPAVEWRASDTWTLRSSALLSEQSQRYRSGQLFRFVDDEQLGGRVGAEWRRGVHRIAPVLFVSRFDHLARASTGAEPLAGTGERDVQSLAEAELAGSTILGAVLLDGGIEARRERIDSDRIPGGQRSLDAVEGFTQLTVARGAFTFVPGVRLVEHSQFGAFAAPRVSMLARVSDALALRASVGRGFRAPDFKELYLSFANPSAGYAVTGNPDLRPERSTSGQLGAEWSGARGWWRVNAFTNTFRDFIATAAPDPSGTYTYENVESGRTRGLETEGGLSRGAWRLDVGYTYLEARDADERPLPSRPAHSGRAALTAPLVAKGSIAATWIITGRIPTGAETPEGPVVQPTFERLDLRAMVPVRGGVRLLLGVDNALDRQMGRDWPGFTGRLVYGGLSWTADGGRAR
jgi:outer membrane receptor for ferrienterochelin and colicins